MGTLIGWLMCNLVGCPMGTCNLVGFLMGNLL